jgi:DNA/RNA-binding domain of Phe-tRNA-synthetase-like protein
VVELDGGGAGELAMLVSSERWKAAYPGAYVGVLAMGAVANPEHSAALEGRRETLEAEIRSRFATLSRGQLKSHSLLAPYTAYYKQFDETYHVQHQLESVAFKGKSIRRGAALVQAMFMAELKNLLLTAGHDLDSVRGELAVDVASGTEIYVLLNGQQQVLKQGDMFIGDELGILSSIIYGPDQRTRITPQTTRVLFTVYAPPGVSEERVRDHLGDLGDLVRSVSSAAEVEHVGVVPAGTGG